MTFLDLVAADPDAPAVDDLTRRRTRGELLDRALRLGHWMLDDGGVPVGGHVAMLIGNRVELIDLLVAAQHAGTWITAINWHLTASEVAYILDDSALDDPLHRPGARGGGRGRPRPRPTTTCRRGGRRTRASRRWPRTPTTSPFPLDGPGGGTMLYTSGTTGRPKGVKRRRQPSLRRDAGAGRRRRAACSASTARARTSSPGRCTTPRRSGSRPSTWPTAASWW